MLASFRQFGKTPLMRDILKMVERWLLIVGAIIFKRFGWILQGPLALLEFSFKISVITSSEFVGVLNIEFALGLLR